MFEPLPTARADLKAGTLYAVSGEEGWLYFGQVGPDKNIGFFRYRVLDLVEPAEVLVKPIMAVVSVSIPSITKALRAGSWRKLGRFELVEALVKPWPSVHWPVGALTLSVWDDGKEYDTRIEDPSIQHMEVMAVWDAESHIPGRLTADFGAETPDWHVGGPVWRERRIKEEKAKRSSSEATWNQLPADWVYTNVR